MTPSVKEPKRQEPVDFGQKPDLNSWASLPCVAKDFQMTVTHHWQETVRPVLGMLSQTISVLWGQAFVPAFKRWLSHSGSQLKSTLVLQKKRPEIVTDASEALNLQKVHGALGERWASEQIDRPIRVNSAQNPWLAAQKKMATLPPRSATTRKSAQTGSTGIHDEEIKGLDDIFTTPVQGSFLDVLKKPGRQIDQPPPAKGAGKQSPKAISPLPTPERSVKPEAATSPPVQTEIEFPNAAYDPNRLAGLLQAQELLREESAKLGKKVKSIAAATQDWFSKNDPHGMTEPPGEPAPLPQQAAYRLYTDDHLDKPALPETSQNTTPVMEPVQASTPNPNALKKAAPAESQTTHSAPLQPSPLAGPVPIPVELAQDLDGCDYMIRNNRILSNSISNLVNQYFQQAALEEKPEYY